jgi:Bacterial toxin 28
MPEELAAAPCDVGQPAGRRARWRAGWQRARSIAPMALSMLVAVAMVSGLAEPELPPPVHPVAQVTTLSNHPQSTDESGSTTPPRWIPTDVSPGPGGSGGSGGGSPAPSPVHHDSPSSSNGGAPAPAVAHPHTPNNPASNGGTPATAPPGPATPIARPPAAPVGPGLQPNQPPGMARKLTDQNPNAAAMAIGPVRPQLSTAAALGDIAIGTGEVVGGVVAEVPENMLDEVGVGIPLAIGTAGIIIAGGKKFGHGISSLFGADQPATIVDPKTPPAAVHPGETPDTSGTHPTTAPTAPNIPGTAVHAARPGADGGSSESDPGAIPTNPADTGIDQDKPGSTKTDRLKEHLTPRDLDAAQRELKGEVVARKSGGDPWDHVSEVRDAQQGLVNRIAQLKKQLADSRSTPTERAAAQTELSEASKLLDRSEQFVPRKK